ncbi:MAG: EutN/CcmL family microcompartment protein [Candidatus Latescibacterota bacterium]
MLLTQVRGHVVSTAKVPSLNGRKLLVVEILNVTQTGIQPSGRHMVCIDAVGAGEGEVTLTVMGSSARMAPGMAEVPTDGVIVGIVDSVQAYGRGVALPGGLS